MKLKKKKDTKFTSDKKKFGSKIPSSPITTKQIHENSKIIEKTQSKFADELLNEISTKSSLKKNDDIKSLQESSLNIRHDTYNRDLRTVFFGNIPVNFCKKKFLKLIKLFGNVERMWIRGVKPTSSKIPKKVAFIKKIFHENHPPLTVYVLFKSVEDAHNALNLNGTIFENNHLRVTLLGNKEQYDNDKGVFVGNLPHYIQENEIWEMFKNCGEIQSVRIVRDAVTGIGKGFGYVNFKSSDAVALALKLNEEELNNRPMRVKRLLTLKQKKKIIKTQASAEISNKKKKISSKNKTKYNNNSKNIKKKSKNNLLEKQKKMLAEKLMAKSKKKDSNFTQN